VASCGRVPTKTGARGYQLLTGITAGQRRTDARLFLVSSSRRARLPTAWTTSTARSSAIFAT